MLSSGGEEYYGNEVECGIYGGWVKTTVQFQPFVDESLCRFKAM